MNTYRNTKTGVEISIPSELNNSGLWVKVNPSPKTTTKVEKEETAPAKKTKKRL